MDELRVRLNEIIAALQTPLLNDGERSALLQAAQAYIAERNKAFDDLLGYVDDLGEDPLAERWNARIDQTSDLVGGISQALRGAQAGAAANSVAQEIATAENRFCATLGKVNLAETRDTILGLNRAFTTLTSNLEDEWARVLSENNTNEAGLDDIAKQVQQAFNDAVTELVNRKTALSRTAETLAKLFLTMQANDPHVADALQTFYDLVLKFKDWSEGFSSDYDRKVAAYRASFRDDCDTVLTMFHQLRQSTDRFVQDHGFEEAKNAYSKADQDLEEFVGGLATAGQKDDARQFTTEALRRLSDHVARMQTVYDEFVQKHQYKFFGPLSPDNREVLTNGRHWEDYTNALTGTAHDLQERLTEWRSDASNAFNIDMSNFTDGARGAIKDQLKDYLQQLTESVGKMQEATAEQSARFARLDQDAADRLLE